MRVWQVLSRALTMVHKSWLLSRPLGKESQNSIPSTWYPVMSKSSHFRQQTAVAKREQPSRDKPAQGSRFNPIYMEPGTIQIDSTKDLQTLYPNSFDCISDMQDEYDIKTDPSVPPVQQGKHKVPTEYKEEIEKELSEMVQ